MRILHPDRLAPSDGKQKFHFLDHRALYRDRIFSQADWHYHMSGWRYMIEPKVLLKVCAALVAPLTVVTVVGIGCAVYEGTRPAGFPALAQLQLSFAYSLIGFALSLLLVFKTNTSYARFWEGGHVTLLSTRL
jgi:ion channel-forming bestrophin family protein